MVVNGTLKKPQVSFFSSPSGLSQNDILSYLIFGYPQSEIKNMGKLEMLNKVVSGLNNGHSKLEEITNKIQNTFGLTNISVGSVDTYDPETNNVQKKYCA